MVHPQRTEEIVKEFGIQGNTSCSENFFTQASLLAAVGRRKNSPVGRRALPLLVIGWFFVDLQRTAIRA